MHNCPSHARASAVVTRRAAPLPNELSVSYAMGYEYRCVASVRLGGRRMSLTMKSLGIDRLSIEERLALVQEIWDSIVSAPDQLPLTEGQKQELDRRLEAHRASPGDAIAWESIRADALVRL